MTNINDIAANFIRNSNHCEDDMKSKEYATDMAWRYGVFEFAKYLSMLTPKEEVKKCQHLHWIDGVDGKCPECNQYIPPSQEIKEHCKTYIEDGDGNLIPDCNSFKPQEPVKCDHTASCVHCWDKQYPLGSASPSNKSTGVKELDPERLLGKNGLEVATAVLLKLNEVIAHINK